MKINAINPRITTRRPDDAPRESYWIHDFRGMRPEPDVTYAFGHAYNHYHRYLSLLRSTFQEGWYRGISRTLESVEPTVCERYRDAQRAKSVGRSLSRILRVRCINGCWAT